MLLNKSHAPYDTHIKTITIELVIGNKAGSIFNSEQPVFIFLFSSKRTDSFIFRLISG